MTTLLPIDEFANELAIEIYNASSFWDVRKSLSQKEVLAFAQEEASKHTEYKTEELTKEIFTHLISFDD